MRTFLTFLAVCCVGFALGVVPQAMKLFETAPPLPSDSAFVRFAPKLLPAAPGNSFEATLTLPAEPQSGAVRIFCDAHEAENSYLAVEVHPAYVVVLAVEAGVLNEVARKPISTLQRETITSLPKEIRVRRKTPYLDVICDGALVLRIAHDGFPGGQVGSGALDATIADFRIQPLDAIVFTDDFMRGGDEQGAWKHSDGGTWEVRSLDHPARSSNAFVYQAVSNAGAVSLVGRPYWDAYCAEVAALGTKQGEMGLVIAASELPVKGALPSRFCFLRWTARRNDYDAEKAKTDSAEAKKEPRLELVLVQDTKPIVLAKIAGGYRPGQWYRLAAELQEDTVTVRIDGRELLSAKHPLLSGGCTGLYAKSTDPVEFDDFRVLSTGGTFDGIFAQQWQYYGGLWSTHANALCGRGTDVVPALAVTGAPSWENVEVRTPTLQGDTPWGLVTSFRDPGNYLAYLVRPSVGKERLVRVQGGIDTLLAEGPYQPSGDERILRVNRGHVRAGGLERFVTDLQPGRVGLLAATPIRANAYAAFTQFTCRTIEPPLPVVSINEVFDNEALMQIWSGAAGDWTPYKKRPSGYEHAFWHRAPFYGDADIEALLPSERKEGWMLGVSLAKDGPKSGYTLTLKQAENGHVLRLFREDAEVAMEDVPGDALPRRMRFRKAGSFFVGLLDDQVRLVWHDNAPLSGQQVAWAAKGLPAMKTEQVQIYSNYLLNESFNSAPSDWRRGGGIWQVTNRWECDPRWSFMAGMPPYLAKSRAEHLKSKLTKSGSWLTSMLEEQLALVPDKDSKLTALWNKRSFDGNVVLECFVGQMMDQNRGGGNYKKYVQNFCVTLCGDGKDLSSGYSCIFGGEKNTRSMIVRQGTVVASAPKTIPTTRNIHRKWFRLRAEKTGNTIRFRAFIQDSRGKPENQLLDLSYEDQEPLAGKRLAVWSYHNGILVGRLRIAAEEMLAREDPLGEYPAEAKCYYTKP